MELAYGIIFEMRRVELIVRDNNGNVLREELSNVYKFIDIDFGISEYINKVEYFIPLSNSINEKKLVILSDNNKKILKNDFNAEGYYSRVFNIKYFYDLCKGAGFDLDKVKSQLYAYWKCYCTLKEGSNFNKIKLSENIEKLNKVFGDGNTINVNKSVLKEYGEFLNDKVYLNDPAIGRNNEIESLEIALLSPDKSAILVGDSGVGKTAIVEGLAYNIKNGLVPQKLMNLNILSVNSSSLISGCRYVGMVEERVNNLIEELKKNKNIIMFIDEIHTLIGSGTGEKSNLDVANILKPYLDRGNIKIIGATTKLEYNNLMNDPAFKRRFKKINVDEPEKNIIIKIIEGTIIGLEKIYNISFNFSSEEKIKIFDILLKVSDEKCRDQFDKVKNPDLVLSILKDAFSISTLYNHNEVLLDDIIKAIKMCDKIYESSREKYALQLYKDFGFDHNKQLKNTNRVKVLTFPDGKIIK